MRAIKTWLMEIIAIVPISTTALASPGDWMDLGSADYVIRDETVSAFATSINDVSSFLKHYHPEAASTTGVSMKIQDVRMDMQGPRQMPRVAFNATARKLFVKISVQGTIDISVHHEKMLSEDFEIVLGLHDSEQWISGNVSQVVLRLKINRDVFAGKRKITVATLMQEGYQKGRFSFPEIQKILRAQVPQIMAAVKAASEERYTASLVNRLNPQKLLSTINGSPCTEASRQLAQDQQRGME